MLILFVDLKILKMFYFDLASYKNQQNLSLDYQLIYIYLWPFLCKLARNIAAFGLESNQSFYSLSLMTNFEEMNDKQEITSKKTRA